jgi:hypothetical protein
MHQEDNMVDIYPQIWDAGQTGSGFNPILDNSSGDPSTGFVEVNCDLKTEGKNLLSPMRLFKGYCMAILNITMSFCLILLAACPSFGEERNHQFLISEFGVVTTKYVSIRESPSIDSKRIDYAHIGLMVKVIGISNKRIEIKNREGSWIKINAEKRYWQEKGPINGWIFSAFLKPLTEFIPIKQWDGFEKFCSCIGDFCQELRMKKDGSFEETHTAIDYDDSNRIKEIEEKIGSGKTYRWGKILWFKLDDKRPNREGYIVVQDDHGQYCLGGNIDPNSGVCHENADDHIYPQPPIRD